MGGGVGGCFVMGYYYYYHIIIITGNSAAGGRGEEEGRGRGRGGVRKRAVISFFLSGFGNHAHATLD